MVPNFISDPHLIVCWDSARRLGAQTHSPSCFSPIACMLISRSAAATRRSTACAGSRMPTSSRRVRRRSSSALRMTRPSAATFASISASDRGNGSATPSCTDAISAPTSTSSRTVRRWSSSTRASCAALRSPRSPECTPRRRFASCGSNRRLDSE